MERVEDKSALCAIDVNCNSGLEILKERAGGHAEYAI